jgi:hypothetical protein
MNLRQARADGAIAVLAVGVPGDSDGVARIVRIPRRLDTLNTFPGSIFNWIPERDGDERHYRIIEDDDKRNPTWDAVKYVSESLIRYAHTCSTSAQNSPKSIS